MDIWGRVFGGGGGSQKSQKATVAGGEWAGESGRRLGVAGYRRD